MKWLCSCLFITPIRISLPSSCTASVRLAYTAVPTTTYSKRHLSKETRRLEFKEIEIALVMSPNPNRCVALPQHAPHTSHRKGWISKQRWGLFNHYGYTDGPQRERGQPARRLKQHTSLLGDAPKFPLSHWKR